MTGLPCGKFPKQLKMKMKKTITEKPYWTYLFGKIEFVKVSSALKMVWKKTVSGKEIRIYFACIAIVTSVLLPTNLKMNILKDNVESMKNLDEFFAFPSGRLAFKIAEITL